MQQGQAGPWPFKPVKKPAHAALAHLVEQPTCNGQAIRSIRIGGSDRLLCWQGPSGFDPE